MSFNFDGCRPSKDALPTSTVVFQSDPSHDLELQILAVLPAPRVQNVVLWQGEEPFRSFQEPVVTQRSHAGPGLEHSPILRGVTGQRRMPGTFPRLFSMREATPE